MRRRPGMSLTGPGLEGYTLPKKGSSASSRANVAGGGGGGRSSSGASYGTSAAQKQAQYDAMLNEIGESSSDDDDYGGAGRGGGGGGGGDGYDFGRSPPKWQGSSSASAASAYEGKSGTSPPTPTLSVGSPPFGGGVGMASRMHQARLGGAVGPPEQTHSPARASRGGSRLLSIGRESEREGRASIGSSARYERREEERDDERRREMTRGVERKRQRERERERHTERETERDDQYVYCGCVLCCGVCVDWFLYPARETRGKGWPTGVLCVCVWCVVWCVLCAAYTVSVCCARCAVLLCAARVDASSSTYKY